MQITRAPNGPQLRGPKADAELDLSYEEMRAAYHGPDPFPEYGVLTLMIRDLPRSYTTEAVMREIEEFCAKETYNFIYLPWDLRRGSNISYAFMNFCSPMDTARCFFHFSGRNWTLVRTAKICRMSPAHIQGLAPNLAHYLQSTTRGIEEGHPHAPVVFCEGKQVDLKAAVNQLCTPEVMWEVERIMAKKKAKATIIKDDGNCNAAIVPPYGLVTDSDSDYNRCLKITHEFKKSFTDFCQDLERKVPPIVAKQIASGPKDGEIGFWYQFLKACLEFAADTTAGSKSESDESSHASQRHGLLSDSLAGVSHSAVQAMQVGPSAYAAATAGLGAMAASREGKKNGDDPNEYLTLRQAGSSAPTPQRPSSAQQYAAHKKQPREAMYQILEQFEQAHTQLNNFGNIQEQRQTKANGTAELQRELQQKMRQSSAVNRNGNHAVHFGAAASGRQQDTHQPRQQQLQQPQRQARVQERSGQMLRQQQDIRVQQLLSKFHPARQAHLLQQQHEEHLRAASRPSVDVEHGHRIDIDDVVNLFEDDGADNMEVYGNRGQEMEAPYEFETIYLDEVQRL